MSKQIIDRDFDQIGEAAERAERPQVPTVRALAAPPDRVFGAQPVAVKRNAQEVMERVKVLAAAAGASYYYSFPVKTKGGGSKDIEGPSIKLANDLAREYGNCDVDIRVIDADDSWLFYARFTDFETGYALTRAFQQRKGQKTLKTDADRQLDMVFQIGQSKAIRNVVVNALQTYSDFAFQEARKSLVEKIGKKLDDYRARVLEALKNESIDPERVVREVGRAVKDWTAPDVAKVIATMQAIADGMTTWDDAFPREARKVDNPFSDEAPTAGERREPEPSRERGRDAAADAADDERERAADEQRGAKPKAETEPKQKGVAPLPTNEAEYRDYAHAWIEAETSATELDDRWRRERDLRAKCGIGEELLMKLAREKDDRIATLREQR